MKIVAFGASSSTSSINKILATYAAHLAQGAEVEVLDLNDYEMPLFSEDREKQLGQPQLAKDFLNKLHSADAIIISLAEHNGTYSAAYKNLFDWCSRITREIFANKPLLLLATSPGPGGASRVLKFAETSAPHFAGNIVATLSIPKFHENFDIMAGDFTNLSYKEDLQKAVDKLS